MATYELELTEADSRLYKLRYLIVEGGKTVLRHSFDRTCGVPPTTYLNHVDFKLEIRNLQRKKVITGVQFDVLYPSSSVSSSENYDITLLVALHRALLCVKSSRDPIWDGSPSPSDISKEADIVRLREFRNKVSHYLESSGPTKTKFDAEWKKISEVLVRLGHGLPDVKSTIDKLKTECFDKEYENKLIEKLKQWSEQDKAFGETIIKTILTHSLSEAALDRSKQELKDVLGKHFVETRVFIRAQKMLKDEGLVVLKGVQGDGKTTISKKLVKNPDRCLKINSPKEWGFYSSENVETVLIDDMFGCAMFDKAECRKWLKHLDTMTRRIEQKNLKVIITSRSYILEEALEKLYLSHLITERNTLTISSKDLTNEEKGNILKSHINLNEREVDDSLVAECVKKSNEPSSYIIGFPECARLFCKEENLYRRESTFFESPSTHINNCLVNVFKSPEVFLAYFVLWAQTPQQLKLRDLEQSVELTPKPILCAIKQLQYSPNETLRTIRATLSNHTNEFIQFDEDKEIFQFSHRVLSDAVGLAIYEKNQTALFSYCDAPFIEKYIQIKHQNTDTPYVGINVMPGRYDQLCLRIGQLIFQGPDKGHLASGQISQSSTEQYLNCVLLMHPAFRENEFCASFFKTLHENHMLPKLLTTPVSTIGASLMKVMHILDRDTFQTEICVLAYALKQSLNMFASVCFQEMTNLIPDTRNAAENVSKNDDVSKVEKILKTDVSMALLVATLEGDKNNIDFLVTKMKANTDNFTLIRIAVKTTNSEVLTLLLDKSGKRIRNYRRDGKSILILFVEEKNVDAVKCILTSKHFDKAEIDYQSEEYRKTALHIACKLDEQECVKQLLMRSPNVNLRDAKQECPIHTAALAGKVSNVQLLLKHDTKQADYPLDINSRFKDMKLYHIAVKNENDELVKLLLNYGVSLTCLDGKRQTPLSFALQEDKCQMAEALIKESIKQNAHTIPDLEGQTALHKAKEKMKKAKSDESRLRYRNVVSKLSAALQESSGAK